MTISCDRDCERCWYRLTYRDWYAIIKGISADRCLELMKKIEDTFGEEKE